VKLLAVSQRTTVIEPHQESRDSLDQHFAGWLNSCGYLLCGIPNFIASVGSDGKCTVREWLDRVGPEGIILSGGDDSGIDSSRDELEFLLLEEAWDRDIPVLGICRGMQMMALWSGAPLTPIEGHAGGSHKLLGERHDVVNSYHHNVVDSVPKRFRETNRSPDGAIESFRHQDRDWEGWMWHPERNNPWSDLDSTNMLRIFGI